MKYLKEGTERAEQRNKEDLDSREQRHKEDLQKHK